MSPPPVSVACRSLLTFNPADPTLLTTTFSDPQPITTDSKYSYLLPSLDMKLELTPEVHAALQCVADTDPARDQLS